MVQTEVRRDPAPSERCGRKEGGQALREGTCLKVGFDSQGTMGGLQGP